MTPTPGRHPLLLTAAAGLVLAACSPATTSDTTTARSGTGTVTVLAAASLTAPLTALAEQYERDHPGVDVRLSFGSSTTLAQQIAEGAPVDLYASAGEAPLALLPPNVTKDGGRATIARNTVEIAIPPDNPGAVRSLRDLDDPDLDVVLCAATVPCGQAADDVLRSAGVSAHVVSREVDVKATLTKVVLGEADAALVYRSDVEAAGRDVRGVRIPEQDNVVLTYPLLWFSTDPDVVGLADLVAGPDGTATLVTAGFLAP